MKILIAACIFFLTMKSYSQQIEKHQWKHRVILIFADKKTSKLLKEQMKILESDKKGLQERKLKIYRFSEHQYAKDFSENWIPSEQKMSYFKENNEGFQVLLIGLDGGVKLIQPKLLKTEQLFTLIDGMPMRRREIQRKNE